ncbi:MAG: NADH-quinone oxidoreductase subunit F, partial [Verrucomicrobiae bacterium]|nr:NADH-quinone oxidoreductase subunit F [Verrucomicrobiae bacterium]
MPAEHRLILRNIDQPGYTTDLECYRRHGGYEALKRSLALGTVTGADGTSISAPEHLRQEVTRSGLRGRGGAGFSCGLKWSLVDRKSGKPIYLVCNADE